MRGICRECAGPAGKSARGYRLYCDECRAERRRQAVKRWRRENPEKLKEARVRWRRNQGVRSREEAFAEIRRRADRLVAKIFHLQAQKVDGKPMSFSMIGRKLGLSRNSIAGLVDRARARGMVGDI